MRQLLSAFDVHLRQERRSTDTIKRYVAVAEKLTDYLWGHPGNLGEQLLSATPSEVAAFLNQAAMTRNGVFSDHMWNQKLAAVRTLFRYLMREKLCNADPTLGLKPKQAETKERIPLSLLEFVALILAMATDDEPYRSRNIALAQFGFHPALRVQELHRLDLDHLDRLNRRIVNLRAKGKKFLTLPFPQIALDDLSEYLKHRNAFCPAPGERAIFLSERGTRLSVRQIQEIISGWGARAGILRRISPHFLRHSVATAHALRGTEPWDVKRLLGHKSLATTDLYIHPMDSLVEAVEALGAEIATMLNKATTLPLVSATLRSGTVSSLRPLHQPSGELAAPLRRGPGGIA